MRIGDQIPCGPLLRKEPHPEHRVVVRVPRDGNIPMMYDCPGWRAVAVTGWKTFFESFAYKPNFHFLYEDNGFIGERCVRITMRVQDSRSEDPQRMTAVQQTHVLESWIHEDFARHWIRRAIQDLELHEIDENLRFNGELVFDPHK